LQGKSLILYLSYEQSNNNKLAPTFNLNCGDKVSMRPIIMKPPYNTIFGLNIEHSTPSINISDKTTPRYVESTATLVDMSEIFVSEKRNFIRIVCVALKNNRILDYDFANYTKHILCSSRTYNNMTPTDLNTILSKLSNNQIHLYKDDTLLTAGYKNFSKRKINKYSKRKINKFSKRKINKYSKRKINKKHKYSFFNI
jgi:hypothetical protein